MFLTRAGVTVSRDEATGIVLESVVLLLLVWQILALKALSGPGSYHSTIICECDSVSSAGMVSNHGNGVHTMYRI